MSDIRSRTVIPFRAPGRRSTDWLTDDNDAPLAVHLVSTRWEMTTVLAWMGREGHPEFIRDVAERWMSQIKEGE